MDETEENSVPSEWLTDLGATEPSSGQNAATRSLDWVVQAGRQVLGGGPAWTTKHLVFQGLLARAQGLHEGSVAAAEAGNPHATFTLIRAYAENTAAILFVTDHPHRLDDLWHGERRGVPIGKITNYASERLAGFRPIYDQLSGFAHPHSRSILASMEMTGDRNVQWHSSPAFRRESDQCIAYAWIIELAEASGHLLVEMGDKLGLRAGDGNGNGNQVGVQ